MEIKENPNTMKTSTFHTNLFLLRIIAFLFFLVSFSSLQSQTTVFSDDFSTNQSASWTTSGTVGSSAWSVLRSGTDWGGRRNTSPAQLELSNDVSGSSNSNGWVFTSTSTGSFSSPYQTILENNTGIVTWTFNMRQITSDPGGFASGSYGVAFIIAGESTTDNNSGNGYAVVLGQSGSTDPVRLITFTNGLQGTLTNLITSNTSGLADFGNQYLSIKVTFNPATNTWELFLRNDGASAFADPVSGTLVSQGSIANTTYSSSALTLMGSYWQGATSANQTAFFDNTKVTVATDPFLKPTPNALAFGYQGNNTPSLPITFSLSGANLTGAPGTITVTAPTHFQVSNNSSVWGTTTTIAFTSSTLPSTVVYVRFNPTSTGAKSGNITFSGGGVTSPQPVAVTGTSVTFKTWDGSSSNNWNTSANWTPSGVPAANDVVLFGINATVSVDANPAQLSGLIISSSAAVTFTSSGGGRTITLSNTGTAMHIQPGSSLTLAGSTGPGTRSMGIDYTGAGNYSSVEGSLILTKIGEGTIYDATNSKTTVSGLLKNDGSAGGTAGTITSTSSDLNFTAGNYEHALNGGIIPTATWNASSTCLINGITNTVPTVTSFAQALGNFTWDCASQSAAIDLAGNLTTVTGNFTMVNTNGQHLRGSTANASYTLTISGDYIQTGGIFDFHQTNDNVNEAINLGGSFNQTGGTFDRSNNTGSFTFNFTGSGQQFTQTGTLSSNYINWNINSGAILKLNNNLPVASGRSCIANGDLDCGVSTAVTGAGTFTLSNSGTLIIGSASGITSSGATGNIQVSGTRTFNTGGKYTYNNTGAQVTGNGLPATINTLTIEGPIPLTLTNSTTTSVPFTATNLAINSGKFELGSAQHMTVTGSTSLTGASCLILKSASGGTASFIDNGISGSGSVLVERYIANDWKWHFLSSPVAAQGIWPEFAPAPSGSPLSFGPEPWNWDFYYWNPNANLTTALYWVNLRKTNGDYNNANVDQGGSYAGFGSGTPPELTVARGYLVSYNSGWTTGSPTVHNFTGSLNTGSISKSVVNGANSYNLVGNPYPSSIDWKSGSGWTRSDLELNGSGYDYWIFNDNAGNYGVFNSSGTTGTNGTSQYIASGQGFFVKASASGTLGMANASKAHSAQTWLKSVNLVSGQLSLKLSNEANNFSDEMIVEVDPSSQGGGSEKFWSFYTEAPEIYAVKDGFNYSIDRYNNLSEGIQVNLGTKTGTESNYLISANLDAFNLTDKVFLEDLKTGVVTDLILNPSYSFIGSPNDDRNRFRLLIGKATGVAEPELSDFNIYSFNRTIFIQNNHSNKTFLVDIYNLLGQVILSREFSGSQLQRIELNQADGLYIVSVISEGKKSSRKVVIR